MALKSRTKVRLSAVLLVLMAMLLGIYAFPQYVNKGIEKFNQIAGTNIQTLTEKPYSLGLDLQGGTHLVYQADVSELEANQIEESMEGVRDVIERRVNILGVSEPKVQINKSGNNWRIIAELAGIKDVNEAVKKIGETPLLEFKEANEEVKTRADQLLVEAKQNVDNFTKFAQENTEKVAPIDFEIEADVEVQPNVDLGYIDNSAFYNSLYEVASNTPVGAIADKVVEWNGGLNIIKVLDKKEETQEFKAAHILICYNGTESCEENRSKEEALALINELKNQAVVGDPFYTLAKENSDEPAAVQTGGELGWFKEGTMVEDFEKAVKDLANGSISDVVETKFGYHL